MFVHRVRQIVKPGELADFVGSLKAVNDAASTVGLPAYRLWATLFGDLNEMWVEADYDSLDGHVQAIEKARDNTDWLRAFRAMLSHVVAGSLRDYPLQPAELD